MDVEERVMSNEMNGKANMDVEQDENGARNQEEIDADAATVATTSSGTTDVISQLEADLALILQIMSSSLHHISNKSAHVQLNSAIPIFQPISSVSLNASKNLLDQQSMHENVEELTDDLIGKAKDMERLLESLPSQRDERAVQDELRQLDERMAHANAEYREALDEAKSLQLEMDRLLRTLCDDHQQARAGLAAEAAEAAKTASTAAVGQGSRTSKSDNTRNSNSQVGLDVGGN